MLKFSEYMTIQTLWKKGNSKNKIAKITGHDWKTVAKIIKNYEAASSSFFLWSKRFRQS